MNTTWQWRIGARIALPADTLVAKLRAELKGAGFVAAPGGTVDELREFCRQGAVRHARRYRPVGPKLQELIDEAAAYLAALTPLQERLMDLVDVLSDEHVIYDYMDSIGAASPLQQARMDDALNSLTLICHAINGWLSGAVASDLLASTLESVRTAREELSSGDAKPLTSALGSADGELLQLQTQLFLHEAWEDLA